MARINVSLRTKRATLSGTVKDQFGKPVNLATVFIKPQGLSTQTDATGAFSIGEVLLDSAEIKITKNNYSTTSESYEFVPESLSVTRAYVLSEKFGTATGTVVTKGVKALGGVIVTTVPGDFTDTTDANGTYSFTGLRLDQLYSLTFTANGFNSNSLGIEATDSVPNVVAKSVELDLVKGSISGTVTDTAGVGVMIATVTASNGTNSYTTTTDTIGAYTLSSMEHGTYTVTFHKEMYGIITLQGEINISKRDISIGALLKKLPGLISGTVTDENNLPLADVTVASGLNTVKTNSQGVYTLPVGELGKYKLAFSKPNYVSLDSPEITLIDSASTQTQNMKLALKVGTVSGTITSGSKSPLAGVTVSTKSGTVLATTDAIGNYTISAVPFGVTTTLIVSLTKYKQVELNARLDEQAPTLSLSTTLIEIPGSISGTVTDTTGAVASGVTVKVQNSTGAHDCIVGTDGKFSIGNLIPGKYKLSVVGETYKDTLLADSITVEMDTNKDLGTIVVVKQLVIVTGMITGKIIGKTGIGIANVLIKEYKSGVSTTTNTNGEFTLSGIPLGKNTLIISKDGYIADTSTSISLSIETDSVKITDIVLIPNTGNLKITIVDSLTKKTLGNVIVSLIPSNLTGVSNDRGEVTINEIPAGTYVIRILKTDYEEKVVSAVAVQGGKETNLNTLSAIRETGTVRGIVKSQTSVALDGVVVTTSTGSADTTDFNGAYSISNIPTGVISLAFNKSEYIQTSSINIPINKNNSTVQPVTELKEYYPDLGNIGINILSSETDTILCHTTLKPQYYSMCANHAVGDQLKIVITGQKSDAIWHFERSVDWYQSNFDITKRTQFFTSTSGSQQSDLVIYFSVIGKYTVDFYINGELKPYRTKTIVVSAP